MSNWTKEPQPFGANHAPLLEGISSVDGETPVPVAVDPATGAILTESSGGGGGGGTSSTFGSTFPTTGTAIGATNGTNMEPLQVDGSGYLEVNVKAGSGSGLSVTDEASFTAGTSQFVPGGGVFNDSLSAITSGQQGTARMTAYRGVHMNLRNNSGTEIGTSTTPVQVSLANTGANATAIAVDDGFNQTSPLTATWTNSTTLNTTLAQTITDYSTIIATVLITGTVSGGVLTFEVYDGANWWGIQNCRVSTYTSEGTYTLATGSQAWEADIGGWQQYRIRLSTVISGTGSALVTLIAQAGAADPGVIVGQVSASQLNATVIGTGTFAVQADTELPAAAALADATTNPTTTSVGSLPLGFNGTTWDRLRTVQGIADTVAGVGLGAVGGYVYNGATWEKMRGDLGDTSAATGLLVNNALLYNGSTYDRQYGDKTNGAWVNIKTGSISNTSFGATQATAANLNATVVPGNATAAAIPSVAMPTGYEVRTSEVSALTNADLYIPVMDKVGKTIALPYANPENFVKGTASATGTSSTSLIGLVSSQKIYVTSVAITNTGATTTYINLQDGSSGTTLYTLPAPAGGGSTHTLPVPIANTAGNAVYFAAGNASTTIYVSAAGYSGV
jgi:hypothetical protein